MYKLLRQGSQDVPTFVGPNGEITLNLARSGIENIDIVPDDVNVLILDHNYIRRLENLSSLYDLQQLSVANNKLLQMHGVSSLKNLTILNLPNNGIVAIDGLSKLTHLRWLNLSGNKLKVIEQLDANSSLKHLDLSDNYISELKNLSFLTKLKTLLLHCNRISTLQGSSNYLPKSLEIISLANNMVSDILEVRELSCIPKLLQFSLGNNPCAESTAYDYKMFVLGWLPNLRILDGAHITAEDLKKASCFVLELKSSSSATSPSQVDLSRFVRDNNSINNGNKKSPTYDGMDHNFKRVCNNSSESSCTALSKTDSLKLNLNYFSEASLNHNMGTPNTCCSEELVPTSVPFNISTPNENTETFQATLAGATAPREYQQNGIHVRPIWNTPVSNNNNSNDVHLHQPKYNSETKCAQSDSMFSSPHSSASCPYRTVPPSSPMLNLNLPPDIGNCSPRKVIPDKEGKMMFRPVYDASSSKNSYHHIYLPLNLPNNSNGVKESLRNTTSYHTCTNSIGNEANPHTIDKQLSSSNTLLSSGNFIPLNQSICSQTTRFSHTSISSLNSSKSGENLRPHAGGLIDAVHLLDDGEDDADDDEDILTERTIQSNRFTGPLEDLIDIPSKHNLRTQEDKIISLPNNANVKGLFGNKVAESSDSVRPEDVRDNTSTQFVKLSDSCVYVVANNKPTNFIDTATAPISRQPVESNEKPKLSIAVYNNPEVLNSMSTNLNRETSTIPSCTSLPVTQDIDTPTIYNQTSSSSASLSSCCPSCGSQTKLLQDHVFNSILLREVEELKAWKESVTQTLANSIKSVNFSSNSVQTDCKDVSQNASACQTDEFSSNTLIYANSSLGDEEKNGIESRHQLNSQVYTNLSEQNHAKDNHYNSRNNNSDNQSVTNIPEHNAKEEQCKVSESDNTHKEATLSTSSSTMEYSEVSELRNTLRVIDNVNKENNLSPSNNNLDDTMQLSTSENTSNIMLDHQSVPYNIPTDSFDGLEDFTDLELVRQAALRAINLDSTSIDTSHHSGDPSPSIVAS
ncbi:unnamed protein product [Heterobilharzia americana]|nr:unnamed protein product [Heterobilharzia americana]